jgi:uncharacterized metal-binding protein YceD (DUF177 family)
VTEPDTLPFSELPRPLAVDRIGPHGHAVALTATEAECAAIAARLMLPAIASLGCRFRLHPLPGGRIAAEGDLRARVSQICVVTLEPFNAAIEERFRIRFVPIGRESDDPDPESEDEIAYPGAVIDLGEALVEQLALSLDPYPRAPGAELPDAASDDAVSPFAALAALRGKSKPS